jgi:hypothetical protein
MLYVCLDLRDIFFYCECCLAFDFVMSSSCIVWYVCVGYVSIVESSMENNKRSRLDQVWISVL